MQALGADQHVHEREVREESPRAGSGRGNLPLPPVLAGPTSSAGQRSPDARRDGVSAFSRMEQVL